MYHLTFDDNTLDMFMHVAMCLKKTMNAYDFQTNS